MDKVKQVELHYKTKQCTGCNGTGWQYERPTVYVDDLGNEYPSPPYISGVDDQLKILGFKQLPNIRLHHKTTTCKRCNGNKVEHFI